jgi:hypothetical protein
VQLWSHHLNLFPGRCLWGHWAPPADKRLSGDWAEPLGFKIGGRAENFQKEVLIESQANLTSLALTVVDILYTGFDYRGTQDWKRIFATNRAPSRAECWSPALRRTLEKCSSNVVTGYCTIITTKMRQFWNSGIEESSPSCDFATGIRISIFSQLVF